MDTEFFDMMDRRLADVCTPAMIRQIETDHGAGQVVWQSLSDSGFLDLLVPEEFNGSGLEWEQAWPVLFAAGRHGMPFPMGQTMWGRALLCHLGVSVPEQAALALSGFGQMDASGFVRARSVPSMQLSSTVIIQAGTAVYAADWAQCELEPIGGPGCFDANVVFKAGEPLGYCPEGSIAQGLAVTLAIQLAGAADRVLEMTLVYANERSQFGKPIGRFQALQQQVSEMAEHVYAMRMASQLAVQQTGWSRSVMQAALAKSQTSASAALVARIAHAVHGAIGVTAEYDLQILTRKLYEMARLGGGEQYWASQIGQAALNQDAGLLDFMRENIFGASSFGQPAA